MKAMYKKPENSFVSVLESTVNQNLHSPEQYEIKDLESADFEAALDKAVRPLRDQLLQKSDIFMISDFPISPEEKTAWEVYRQALRDLPESVDLDEVEFIDELEWPEAPGSGE